jgi:hypothetical protein
MSLSANLSLFSPNLSLNILSFYRDVVLLLTTTSSLFSILTHFSPRINIFVVDLIIPSEKMK